MYCSRLEWLSRTECYASQLARARNLRGCVTSGFRQSEDYLVSTQASRTRQQQHLRPSLQLGPCRRQCAKQCGHFLCQLPSATTWHTCFRMHKVSRVTGMVARPTALNTVIFSSKAPTSSVASILTCSCLCLKDFHPKVS